MSDLGFHFTPNPSSTPGTDQGPAVANGGFALLQTLAQPAGFRPDARFSVEDLAFASPPEPEAEAEAQPDPAPTFEDAHPASDPVVDAFSEGFSAGYAQANAEAEARAMADRAASERLDLAFTRLDAALAEQLRERLRDTVELLCAGALAPLALDVEALDRRITRAVAMLSRADDERTLRLHPDDLALVLPRLLADWQVEPDATLERGTVRVDTPGGGVEDGPATWRLAIAEALAR